METALIQALGALSLELLKSYGLTAIPSLACGLIWWRAEVRLKTKDAQIEDLETRIQAAKDKRLEDALQMIQVAKTGTETMAARTQDDAKFHEAIGKLTSAVETLVGRASQPPRSRR